MPRRYRRRSSTSDLILGLTGISVLLLYGLQLSREDWNRLTIILWTIAISLIFLLLLGVFFFNRRKQQKMAALRKVDIDQMSGAEFEEYLAFLFRRRGFTNVTTTRLYGDFGADLVAKKDNIKYAIQAKRWRGLVGVDAVYQVLGGKDYYGCQGTIVVTNSKFTYQAEQLAQKSNTTLVNGDTLAQWIIDSQKTSEDSGN